MEIREGHNKFYISDEQGKQIVETVFAPTRENSTTIEHIDVDESLKEQGVGRQLAAKVVEEMHREKRRIIPLCPFARHEFDKTWEYSDIHSWRESMNSRYSSRSLRRDAGKHPKGRRVYKEWAKSASFCPKSSPLLSKKKNISYMRIINWG